MSIPDHAQSLAHAHYRGTLRLAFMLSGRLNCNKQTIVIIFNKIGLFLIRKSFYLCLNAFPLAKPVIWTAIGYRALEERQLSHPKAS